MRRSDVIVDVLLLDRRIRLIANDTSFIDLLKSGFETAAFLPVAQTEPAVDLRVEIHCERSKAVPRRLWRVETEPRGALDQIESLIPLTPDRLISAINLWVISQTRKYYAFHAGVVARDGLGILLPATSYSGKSTLTAALIQRGFVALSDEIGALELASGRLVGYPRALSLRLASLKLLDLEHQEGLDIPDGRMLRAASLGGAWANTSVEPRLIILPFYSPTKIFRCERLRAGPAVLALFEAASSQPYFKTAGLDLIIGLAKKLPCYRLIYSDLLTAVNSIEELHVELVGP